MDRFCVIFRPPSLFLFPFARRYGFPRDVAHTRCNADTRMYARTRRYAQRRGGTSSPSGSHVFPTASRSYNGAVASRRPGRRERTNERVMQRTAAPAAPEFVVLYQTGRSPPATRLPTCVVLPEATGNVGRDLEIEEDAGSLLFGYRSLSTLLRDRYCFFFLSKNIRFVLKDNICTRVLFFAYIFT